MIKCNVGYNVHHQGIELFFVELEGPSMRTTRIGKPIEFVDYEPNKQHEPTVRIGDFYLQDLLDGLWRMGLRPTQNARLDDTIAAKDSHIQDLRQITFSLLEKTEKGM